MTLFPGLGLAARDVTLANVPGGKAKSIVHVESMRLAVRLVPLLHGRIEATEVALDRPDIALEVAADGSGNWELVRRHTEQSGLRLPANTLFSGITIRHGRVSYDNARLRLHRSIEALDADIALTRLADPAKATGSFVQRGRKLAFSATVGTIRTLLAGIATKVDMTLDADFVHAAFLGFVSSDGTAKGSASLRTGSVRDLAAWLGRPLAAGGGLGPLTALADIAARGRHVVLTRLKAKLDGMSIGGTLAADLHAPVPDASGDLSIDHVDLNIYLHLADDRPGPPPPPGPASGGWSKAAIRLDLLKLMNGHLTPQPRRPHRAPSASGADPHGAGAPGRRDGGAYRQDRALWRNGYRHPRRRRPRRGAELPQHAQLHRYRDAPVPGRRHRRRQAGGTGSVALDVAGAGATPDAIMRGLSGRGTAAIANGQVRGVDMGEVARTIQTILSAGATGRDATTAFDRFSGSFTIAKGVLVNKDLALSSAYLHMTGAGAVDLGSQTLAFRIAPRASIGGRMNLLDVGVPFAVYGPWTHLRYVPDLAGAMTGLVGSILEKGAAPLDLLLGGLTPAAPPGKPPSGHKPKGIGDTLKGLFGLH